MSRYGPKKITLAQCRAMGDTRVLFHCERPGLICSNSGEMLLSEAIKRWGASTRLDQIPARCTRCESREFVDVRADNPRERISDGMPAAARLLDAWRAKRA